MKILKNFENFLNEELTHLPPPSDDETFDAMKDLDAIQIANKCVQYGLGDNIFQLAIDKGLLNKITMSELLEKAIESNSLKYVKYAIEHGGKYSHALTEAGLEPLTLSAKKGYLDIFKYLVENKDILNIRNKEINDSLIIASKYNNFEIVKYLINIGADINYQNDDNRTALMFAAYKGNFEIVKYLIEEGADLYLRNKHNQNAQWLAQMHKHREISDYILNKMKKPV